MTISNNITRLLEKRKIPYTAHELPLLKLSAVEVAEFLKLPAAQVFKTIVLTRTTRGKPILAVIPGNREVDLKAVARFIGEKKVSLPTQAEAEKLTGLQAGGISPLALLQKGFQVLLDDTAPSWDTICISGGQRGLNLSLSPTNLLALTTARLAPISSEAIPE
jgi:Cys-tRNA(Pro)/Cys-tRNA(Cys) deacylase